MGRQLAELDLAEAGEEVGLASPGHVAIDVVLPNWYISQVMNQRAANRDNAPGAARAR